MFGARRNRWSREAGPKSHAGDPLGSGSGGGGNEELQRPGANVLKRIRTPRFFRPPGFLDPRVF